MSITKAMKNNERLRLVYGHRWMVWNPGLENWWAMEHKPGRKLIKEIIVTEDKSEALTKLLEE